MLLICDEVFDFNVVEKSTILVPIKNATLKKSSLYLKGDFKFLSCSQ
jgi:hypothetical protein